MKRTIVPKKRRVSLELEAVALQKMLMTVFAFPEVEFSLTELAERADVSKSTASRILKKLEDYGIIKVEEKKIVWRIKADIGNFKYIKRKIVHNLNMVYQTNLTEFLEEALGHPRAIILFGSFRKGDDISTSDIDIAVEFVEEMETHTIQLDGLEDFESLFGKKIQLIAFNRKKVDANVFNSIANGIVLLGHLEVKP